MKTKKAILATVVGVSLMMGSMPTSKATSGSFDVGTGLFLIAIGVAGAAGGNWKDYPGLSAALRGFCSFVGVGGGFLLRDGLRKNDEVRNAKMREEIMRERERINNLNKNK